MSGAYDVARMLLQYPVHLFTVQHIDGVAYREFGLYAYFFIAAMALMLWKAQRRDFALILLWWVLVLFAVLEFLPSNTQPWYLPIPRQERYLEILALPMVLVIAWGMHWLARRYSTAGCGAVGSACRQCAYKYSCQILPCTGLDCGSQAGFAGAVPVYCS